MAPFKKTETQWIHLRSWSPFQTLRVMTHDGHSRPAQTMGVTMDAKSWGAKNWKEFLRDCELRLVDAAIAVSATGLFRVGIYIRFVISLGRGTGVMNPC